MFAPMLVKPKRDRQIAGLFGFHRQIAGQNLTEG